jgi:hypothetical protein
MNKNHGTFRGFFTTGENTLGLTFTSSGVILSYLVKDRYDTQTGSIGKGGEIHHYV